MHLVVPLENQFSLLYTILKEHISDDVNYKVRIFINLLHKTISTLLPFLVSIAFILAIYLSSFDIVVHDFGLICFIEIFSSLHDFEVKS